MKLKSQNEYRRLRKPFIFILSIILTLSICSLEGFKKPYRADTYYKGYTTQYGSYSLVETNLFGNTRVQSLFMYAFNGVYNGRIRIYYTAASYNGTDSILPINCTIESRSDSYLQVTFKNVSEICIIFQNANLNPIDITSVQYPGDNPMTKITNGTNNQLETIETILYNIQTTNQTIANNSSGIATTNSQLTTLNNNVNSILSQISSYFTTNNGTTINIGDIILQFNQFNAQLQLQLGILNDLKSALLDIDNKIDTITWGMWTSIEQMTYSTTGTDNYTYSTGSRTGNTYFNIGDYSTNPNSTQDKNNLYKLYMPIGSFSSYPKIEYFTFYTLNTSGSLTQFYVENTYIQYLRTGIVLYFTLYGDNSAFNNPNGNNLKFIVKYKNSCYQYAGSATLQYINSSDIEYWSLLSNIRTFNYQVAVIDKMNTLTPINYNTKLDDIISAINNLNMSVTNTTVNDTQVNIENYNDIMTDIENIEINFNTEFNTNSNSITQQSISDPGSLTFSHERQLLTKVTNELIMNNSKMKYIVYIILLGFVVIRIMG